MNLVHLYSVVSLLLHTLVGFQLEAAASSGEAPSQAVVLILNPFCLSLSPVLLPVDPFSIVCVLLGVALDEALLPLDDTVSAGLDGP